MKEQKNFFQKKNNLQDFDFFRSTQQLSRKFQNKFHSRQVRQIEDKMNQNSRFSGLRGSETREKTPSCPNPRCDATLHHRVFSLCFAQFNVVLRATTPHFLRIHRKNVEFDTFFGFKKSLTSFVLEAFLNFMRRSSSNFAPFSISALIF